MDFCDLSFCSGLDQTCVCVGYVSVEFLEMLDIGLLLLEAELAVIAVFDDALE